VRLLALAASLMVAGVIVTAADDEPWGIAALLPGLLAIEIGRQLWRDRRASPQGR